ncbi:MAG TPA: hypothetical protein ENH38_07855 [Nitrospirae bacterium]|nr:hypothetical protein [Nitrospirota bacterium]HDZ88515.1 hypothetical protein [Nitrospirota bacterium]
MTVWAFSYLGNRTSGFETSYKISPACSSARKIKPANLVKFKSQEETVKTGYEPCKRCNPLFAKKNGELT